MLHVNLLLLTSLSKTRDFYFCLIDVFLLAKAPFCKLAAQVGQKSLT